MLPLTMLTYAHVCARMLTYAAGNVAADVRGAYAHGCSRMLTDADARMLTYADVC